MSGGAPLSDDEIDAIFERAEQERDAKMTEAMKQWGIGLGGSWSTDLERGVIRFDTPRGRFIGSVQFIGTFNPNDGSWLWGWDHPTPVPAAIQEHAGLVREFGERNGLEALTTRRIEAEEIDGWAFAALARHLAGAQGVYRAPSGSVLTFLTFDGMAPDAD